MLGTWPDVISQTSLSNGMWTYFLKVTCGRDFVWRVQCADTSS